MTSKTGEDKLVNNFSHTIVAKKHIIPLIVILSIMALALIVVMFLKFNNPLTTSSLAGKVFMVDCASGEQGEFKSDFSIEGSHGIDYGGPDDTRSSVTTGTWSIEKNVLTISGTTLSNGKYSGYTQQKLDSGKRVYDFSGEGCGLVVGDSITDIKSYLADKY